MASEKIAVVTVHGTGDTAEGLDGEKWFQRGSTFSSQLQASLRARGVDSEIVPHLWTGANSASAREKGSIALAKRARKLAKSHAGVHVIGHSHGGNVANDAACMLNWHTGKKRPRLASVTTVGTPFFRTIVKRSEKLGAWAFLLMVIVSLCVFTFSIFYFRGEDGAATAETAAIEQMETAGGQIEELVENPGTVPEAVSQGGGELEELVIGLVGVGLMSGLAILFIIPLAFRGIARIRRAGRKKRDAPSLFTIWHPNDEAIAFLQRVEALPVEVFPKWSLLKGSRTGAILWGVRAAIWTPIVGLLIAIGAEFGTNDDGEYLTPLIEDISDMGATIAAIGLVAAPLIFGAVYVIYRAIVAVMLEFAMRGYLNSVVGNALKGLAMGRDGDNRIGEVSERSHYYGCEEQVLDGDLAERMRVASHEATRLLFEKYRASLFSVGVTEDNAVAELAEDAMTWDSLIHTTYFDQPEVAEMIAEKISSEVKNKRGGLETEMPQAAG